MARKEDLKGCDNVTCYMQRKVNIFSFYLTKFVFSSE